MALHQDELFEEKEQVVMENLVVEHRIKIMELAIAAAKVATDGRISSANQIDPIRIYGEMCSAIDPCPKKGQ